MVTAVIPCGGQGTRIAAVARGLPKELLSVAGKPLLEWTLEEAAAAGLTRAVVVSSPDKAPALEAHVTAHPPAGLTTTIVLQPHARGLGDAGQLPLVQVLENRRLLEQIEVHGVKLRAARGRGK